VASFRVVDCTCGGPLKPDVVFFGENVPAPRVAQAMAQLERGAGLLVVSTSLAVYSGLRFVLAAQARGLPIAIATLGETRGDRHRWELDVLEDPESNVFHKALFIDADGACAGVVLYRSLRWSLQRITSWRRGEAPGGRSVEVRRGGQTAHLIYGEAQAIDSGTAAYFIIHKLLLPDVSPQAKLRL
jgi:hypothetical protein